MKGRKNYFRKMIFDEILSIVHLLLEKYLLFSSCYVYVNDIANNLDFEEE